MLRYIRESLVLFLIILLPFHALLVTGGTKFILGAGQAPLPILAAWKELIIGSILVIALGEWLFERISNLKLQTDTLDWLILGLIVLGFVIPSTNFLFGFKYTLFPLCVFFVLRRVPWSDEFIQKVWTAILIVGGLVAGYGIFTFFLPMEFFTWLGYSDLHSLYLPDGPLAAFQQIGGTGIRRIQSTMSGPNQLGIWLLIPLSILLSGWVEKFSVSGDKKKRYLPLTGGGRCAVLERAKQVSSSGSRRGFITNPPPTPSLKGRGAFSLVLAPSREGWPLAVLVLFVSALFLTFSRAAWMGALAIAVFALCTRSRETKHQYTSILVYSGVWLLLVAVIGSVVFPDIFLRTFSSRDHLRRPLEAVRMMAEHPLGLGLGSAGPASNRVSDACVFLEPGADASWASDRPDLCVFVGNEQIQPVHKTCQCPFLPENWYMQVGVELGIFGFLLFVALIVGLLREVKNFVFLSMLGISVAALFLHAWEDAAVAYTVWILLAMMLPCVKDRSLSSTLGASTRT